MYNLHEIVTCSFPFCFFLFFFVLLAILITDRILPFVQDFKILVDCRLRGKGYTYDALYQATRSSLTSETRPKAFSITVVDFHWRNLQLQVGW